MVGLYRKITEKIKHNKNVVLNYLKRISEDERSIQQKPDRSNEADSIKSESILVGDGHQEIK